MLTVSSVWGRIRKEVRSGRHGGSRDWGALGTQVKFTDCGHDHIRWILYSPALQADSLPSGPQGKSKNTGVGSLSLLQGSFPTQDLNRGLLHCRRILYQLSYQGSPKFTDRGILTRGSCGVIFNSWVLHSTWSESESDSVVSDALWPYELYSPRNSLGQNTGVGSLSLLPISGWDLPNPGIEPSSLALKADSLPAEPQGFELNWDPNSGLHVLKKFESQKEPERPEAQRVLETCWDGFWKHAWP